MYRENKRKYLDINNNNKNIFTFTAQTFITKKCKVSNQCV